VRDGTALRDPDGWNRRPSKTFAAKKTCYAYGTDGRRPKKIDNLAIPQDCATIPASAPATVYFGAVENRNWKLPGEQVITYPHPNVKLVNGRTPAEATYLHRDHLGSIRAITTPAGVKIESAVYKPFGPSRRTGSRPARPRPRARAGSAKATTPMKHIKRPPHRLSNCRLPAPDRRETASSAILDAPRNDVEDHGRGNDGPEAIVTTDGHAKKLPFYFDWAAGVTRNYHVA
jgi:hypothetical protein